MAKKAPNNTNPNTSENEQKGGEKLTPLMKQYYQIKGKHPGAILLFRVGDFYEAFADDAIAVAAILNITLTKRSNGSASEVALAGFPHHALDNYLPKLVKAGKRVAICDQLEDPKQAIGLVKRGVTELVTPGVVLNDQVLNQKSNNFLCAIHAHNQWFGVAFLDLSTGEFLLGEGDALHLDKLLQNFAPSEIIFNRNLRNVLPQLIGEGFNTFPIDDWVFQKEYAEERLTRHFEILSLKGFGVEQMPDAIIAAGAIMFYLNETEHKNLGHLTGLARIEAERYMWLDRFSIRNLELLYPQFEQGTPLIDILDYTLTPMGARMLRQWISLPLKDKEPIIQRQLCVRAFLENADIDFELRKLLKPIGDLERLISKVASKRVGPREMVALKRALYQLQPIKALLSKSKAEALKVLADAINACEFLYQKIHETLAEEVPILVNQGGFIREGFHPELDELRALSLGGKEFLSNILQREIENTGISSLKINYNKVFGYYLEVTNAHKDKVPPTWIRKQTLVGAERYITEELKIYEEKILSAEGSIAQLESFLFGELIEFSQQYIVPVQQSAKAIAQIDCLRGFAELALSRAYCCPELNEETALKIIQGRHPVIESQLPQGEAYVPNDIYLDTHQQQIIIITGPNMAGKSALLRQTALIVLMAQIGSFVPASAATIGLVDKIFTRVGASDNLSKGESTFMVEMTETASILNNLSERSLILMDEIGRGTSTYDGVSIAWAIVEYLHKHPKCRARTLFATHYHELNALTEQLERVKNFNVSVKQIGGKVVFLRKLKEGGSEHSFGINVAQLAGMPNQVVLRAAEIMKHLEKEHGAATRKEKLQQVPKANMQLSFFEPIHPEMHNIQTKLKEVNVNELSPVQALVLLYELKQMAER